jgi:hypothetical protein
MSKLSDLTNKSISDLLGNMTLNKAVLAINAASAATVKTTSAITFTNNGVLLTKAALAAQSVVATHFMNGKMAVTASQIQPISSTAYYTLGLDGSGNVCVSQGSVVGQNLSQFQMGVSAVGDGLVPDVPTGFTPFGVIKVVTNGATTFQIGTTALDAAGCTFTFFDVAVMPAGLL